MARLDLGMPKRGDVVIFDSFSERHLKPLLLDVPAVVFDVSLSRINLWALVGSLRFGMPSLRTYLCAYISLSRARVVVTTIDNSPIIYQVKNSLPSVKVFVIQNGRRSTFGKAPWTSFVDELNRSKKFGPNTADYYFTFGTTEHQQFANLINTHFEAIGSIKNNYLEDEFFADATNVLTFISSFPNFDNSPDVSFDNDETYLYFQDMPISFGKYFEAEIVVARWLQSYCRENSYQFQIVGKRSFRTLQEEEFFRKNVPGDWKFIPCNTETDSYRALFRSRVVASVDSSLAYEMFGRGKRTVFFTIRADFTSTPGLRCTKFGYPAVSAQNGPMWTNESDESQFARITDFVVNCSEDDWKRTVKEYAPVVMEFDPLNSVVAAKIAEALELVPPSSERIRQVSRQVYG